MILTINESIHVALVASRLGASINTSKVRCGIKSSLSPLTATKK